MFFLADGPDRGSVREAGHWEETLQSERVAGCHRWMKEEQEEEERRNKNVRIVSNVIADHDP